MNKNSKNLLALTALVGLSFAAKADDLGFVSALGSVTSSTAVNTYLPDPSRYGSVSSLSNAIPGTADGDAAYSRNMRIEYAKDALANSTANAEANMRKQSAQTANCTQIVTAADTAKKSYVVRHMAPDPTQVIQGSTCFVDIMKIKIPKSGYALVDGLVSKLGDFVGKSQCTSTTGYWDKIAGAAQSGNVSGLASTAITAGSGYVSQEVFTASTATGGQASGTTTTDGGWVTQPTTSATPVSTPAPATSVMNSLIGWIKP